MTPRVRGRKDHLTEPEREVILTLMIEGVTGVKEINERLAAAGIRPISQRTLWSFRRCPEIQAELQARRDWILSKAQWDFFELLQKHAQICDRAKEQLLGDDEPFLITNSNWRMKWTLFQIFDRSACFIRDALVAMGICKHGLDLLKDSSTTPLAPDVLQVDPIICQQMMTEANEILKSLNAASEILQDSAF